MYTDGATFKEYEIFNFRDGIECMWKGNNFLSYGAKGEDIVHPLPTTESKVIKMSLAWNAPNASRATTLYTDVESSDYVHIAGSNAFTGSLTLVHGQHFAVFLLILQLSRLIRIHLRLITKRNLRGGVFVVLGA